MNEWWLRKPTTECYLCSRPRIEGKNICAVHASSVTFRCAGEGCDNPTPVEDIYCRRCREKQWHRDE